MITINFCLGVAGLILAGDSLGRGVRDNLPKIFLFGLAEALAGVYFIVAMLGSAT